MTAHNKPFLSTPGRRFLHNPMGLVGAIIVSLSILVAVFAYLLMPDNSKNANQMSLQLSTKPPGFGVFELVTPGKERVIEGEGKRILASEIHRGENQLRVILYPSGEQKIYSPEDYGLDLFTEENIQDLASYKTFWLGTDKYGRDLLSRIILGTRISLAVGAISVIISLVLGLLMGSLAGFFGGKTDAFISWIINVVWSIPTLLLVIAITLTLGKGFWQVFVAVGLTMWVEVARVVRGQIMSLKGMEYIEAAKVVGYSDWKIITGQLLPNILGPVIVISAANFASAILIEAGLSFLGIGAQPPTPSWGGMIKDHYAYIVMDKAYLALYPGLAIMLLVLAFILIGNALRDALDVRD